MAITSRPNGSQFYTVKEVASLLGISITTAYEYVHAKSKKGGLPVKRFGRNCIRIPKDKFNTWAGLAEGD